jgi:hypothetical protein
MATPKKISKYAPKPEFLDACRSRGMQAGTLTGKAEFAVAKATYVTVVGTVAATQGLIAGHKASR